MSGTPGADDWFPLVELTERLAALVWVERSTADVLDRWVAAEPNDRVVALFARAAAHHRWHAEILQGALPTSPQLGDAATPRAPHAQWESVVARLADVVEPERTATRLTSIVRHVGPWLDREVDALLACARPVADAALIRWLRFVALDHLDDGEQFAIFHDASVANTVDLGERSFLQSIELRSDPSRSRRPD